MKGGFLVAYDASLFDRIATVVLNLGGVSSDTDGGFAQVADADERLFTAYGPSPVAEWEYREGPFYPAAGVQMPDMQEITACAFECRWEDLVVRISDLIARTSEAPTWLLDGNSVIWSAEAVDPTRVVL
jgi:hypothetical protein